MHAIVVLDGVALADPVLEAPDEFAHGVPELRELERPLDAGIASGTPAVDDDRSALGDLPRRTRGDLPVVHVHGSRNAALGPGLVRAHIGHRGLLPGLPGGVQVAGVRLVLESGGEEVLAIDHGLRLLRRGPPERAEDATLRIARPAAEGH